MKFNERLLVGIPGDLVPLAKLYLFCIHEGIELAAVVNHSEGRAVWTEDVRADLGKITNLLLQNGVLDVGIVTATDEMIISSRIRLNNLYVAREVQEFNINNYRTYFSMNYIGIPNRMGDKNACTERMEKFLQENPYTFAQVMYTSKHFVDWHVARGLEEMVPKADKFIYDNHGHSRLLEHMENINLDPNE